MDHVPERDSKRYGDPTFGAIMLAKVICVHLVNDLGYDLLFQDVDISWYKNPLDFFNSPENSGFDIYAQGEFILEFCDRSISNYGKQLRCNILLNNVTDDGNRQVRFAPYSANSGLYFVRSNGRSKYLFRSMMYAGDIIFAARSHQQILIQLLAEHNSLSGLRVKVLSREGTEFPSGFHYNMNANYMKQLAKGETKPYAFHMCWTLNREDKVAYMKQMGMWYLNDKCVGKEAASLGDINNACCSAEPIIECFYQDKASIIPCKDSPLKDKGSMSFW